MEITIDTLLNIAGLVGSGGVGGFFVWKWQRRKAKAEAETAEVNMAKEVQDIYQQALKDKDEEVADKNRIIDELREDRDRYKKNSEEMREKLENVIRELKEIKQTGEDERAKLQMTIDTLTHKVDSMEPNLCFRKDCIDRISASDTCNKRKRFEVKKSTKE